jgi:hypothetical protein
MLLTREFSRVAVSYAHLRSMLVGLNKKVHSVGIITAHNPEARTKSPELNNLANKKLRRDLEDAGLVPVGGVYFGKREKSFVVPNMDLDFLLEMGRKYRQETVIYGKRIKKDGKEAFQFEFLGSKDGKRQAYPETVVTGKEEIYKEDFEPGFSYLGGEKPREQKYPGQVLPTEKRFFIPFRFPEEGESIPND